MYVKSALVLLIGLSLAACVAPEEPTPVRSTPVASPAATTPPRADLEPAPIPNRHVGPPTGNALIRVQQ